MRKKSVIIALVILAIGLIGTGLSSLHTQIENTDFTGMTSTFKVSYGFPLGWHGYSGTDDGSIIPVNPSSMYVYWFSLESFLLDAALWFAVSFFVTFATIKSVNVLHKTRTSKNLSFTNTQK